MPSATTGDAFTSVRVLKVQAACPVRASTACKSALEVADVDEAVRHAGGRLADVSARFVGPEAGPGAEVEGEELAGLGPHVHDAARDGGRRLDDLARLVGPGHAESGRAARGDAAQPRLTAELWPLVGRGG